jgi:hypothetical protein
MKFQRPAIQTTLLAVELVESALHLRRRAQLPGYDFQSFEFRCCISECIRTAGS